MIDINDLWHVYTFMDNNGNERKFKLIFTETFDTIIGNYEESPFTNYNEYLVATTSVLMGFVDSPYDITWYARSRDESDIVEAVKEAHKEGNDTIVIEYIGD